VEVLTIVLASLFTLISPAGFVVDQVAERTIRSRLAKVEELQVRVDNAPSYQIAQGRAERIRIAGRGLFPFQDVRLEALELETDPVNLKLGRSLRRGLPLQQPLNAGIRLILKEEDINRALRSPSATAELRQLGVQVLEDDDARQVERYELINPQVEFLDNQRIRVQVELRETGDPTTLAIFAELGVEIVGGRRVRLIAPVVRVNNKLVPEKLLSAIVRGVLERSDLRQLEKSGITARILHWRQNSGQIDLAAFVQISPNARF
jgi:hypothetical protein